jgi:hypothetical protein
VVKKQLMKTKRTGEPKEVQFGFGEDKKGQDDPVQQQLQGLMQHMEYIIEVCNSEKEVTDEEFLSVHQEIHILEGQIRTE